MQGLELDYLGLIWGGDLVWRRGHSVPVRGEVADNRLQSLPEETLLRLLKNRYRILLTRSLKGLAFYCADEDTHSHLTAMLG